MKKEGMRTTGELKKFIGVTKKTLREYARVGLLYPSNDKEVPQGKQIDPMNKKQWLYNEEAVSKLIFIQIFRKAGYTRNAIKTLLDEKKIFDQENVDALLSSYEEAILKIEDELRETRGMLRWLKIQRINALNLDSLSDEAKNIVFSSFEKISIEDCFGGNFDTSTKKIVNLFSELSMLDEMDSKSDSKLDPNLALKFERLSWLMGIITQLNLQPVDSKEVQVMVGEAYKIFMELESEYEVPSFLELTEGIIESSARVAEDNDVAIDFNFVLQAIHIFCKEKEDKK